MCDFSRGLQILKTIFFVMNLLQTTYRRGALYWLLCLAMIAVQTLVSQTGFGLNFFVAWIMIALVFVCGLLYIVSYFNGESEEGECLCIVAHNPSTDKQKLQQGTVQGQEDTLVSMCHMQQIQIGTVPTHR